ncbi:MAG: ATPase [Salinarimonas sp.]|nr:ATPase [Salinarimonas sp.]
MTLAGGSFAREAFELLMRHDLIERENAARKSAGARKSVGARKSAEGRATTEAPALISEAGKAFLARLKARREARDDEAFASQHRDTTLRDLPDPSMDSRMHAAPGAAQGDMRIRVRVNQEESPLAWLAARKGADGAPLIDAAQFQAGERFRRDLTMAGIMPGVSIDWDRLGSGGGGGGYRAGKLDATETCIAARQRVARAVRHLGGEDGDLLIDVCGFLTRITEVERARGWPARSGKIMIARALSRLADHYGLAVEARGASRSRRILAWCAGESAVAHGVA